MTPRRAGLLIGVLVAAGFLSISEVLYVRPGHPIAERTDVFFQSDAGGLIQDAILNRDFRARGTHPLLYPLWTRPLHALARGLESTIDPRATATFASRLLVALIAGIGVGTLAGVLAARGFPLNRLVAFAALVITANGNSLAAIPDHFGFSVGAIGLTFAAMLTQRSHRFKITCLACLAPICFGITVTNVILPIGLIAVLVLGHRYLSARRWLLAAAFLCMIGTTLAIREGMKNADIRERVQERVSLYLNLRLVESPFAAASYTIRGIGDLVVAPTPRVGRNNLDRMPMLTYESDAGLRPFWPHDAVQTAGALVWFAMLAWGARAGLRDPAFRPATIGALGWAAGNAAFHNIWGDEYFLYSPHIALPLLLVAAYGFRTMPVRVFYPSLAVVVGAASYTLHYYHLILNGITE